MKENKMKQNSLELTQSQVKRVIEAKKGETIMLMFPIELIDNNIKYEVTIKNNIVFGKCEDENFIRKIEQPIKDFIKQEAPTQKGDKDIFIQEEWQTVTTGKTTTTTIYKSAVDKESFKDFNSWRLPFEMTKEQSRLTIGECVDVSVVRIFDLKLKEIEQITSEPIYVNLLHYELMLKEFYNTQLKEQNISRTYEDNDYVFLMEFIK